MYIRLFEPDQISHTQSTVVNQANIQTPTWKSCLKRSVEEFHSKKKKTKNADARVWEDGN